ncbi:response regulator transcription factor [Aquimarina algicola]|uniref:Response regulator transcription factor n=1 Tax=Aquimarina algicola TaxID=2589995 RepID=A0A504JRF8_9FLAO|nr:response regulator transcription factor [Aquimarina algicola]TPN88950.1 response regulator transcription factor [Aquimarina algicola]
MKKETIKIIIVDDHPMVIEGLKTLLNDYDTILITSCFTNGKDALTFLEKQKTDVVLLDVNLPDISGIEICKIIKKNHKDVNVLGLSTYNEPSIVNQMIKNGVNGYLLKNTLAEELVNAITQIYKGNFYFGNEIQNLLANFVNKDDELPKLTRREKHILSLIANGLTTNQIAEKLFISPLTVETHRRNLIRKMDVKNAAALVKIAIEKNLI